MLYSIRDSDWNVLSRRLKDFEIERQKQVSYMYKLEYHIIISLIRCLFTNLLFLFFAQSAARLTAETPPPPLPTQLGTFVKNDRTINVSSILPFPLIQVLLAKGRVRKYVHLVLVSRLGGLSLLRNSVSRLTDRFDMTFMILTAIGRKI